MADRKLTICPNRVGSGVEQIHCEVSEQIDGGLGELLTATGRIKSFARR